MDDGGDDKKTRSKGDSFDKKMKDLACKESSSKKSSSMANFLSVGLMILCSLLKM